jgi:hypothetical protein
MCNRPDQQVRAAEVMPDPGREGREFRSQLDPLSRHNTALTFGPIIRPP